MPNNVAVPKGTTDLGTLTIGAADSLFVGEGGQAVTTTLDKSALSSLTNVLFDGPFTGDFGGGSSGFFKARIATLMTLRGGGGTVYFQSAGSGSTVSARIKQIGSQRLVMGGGGTCTLFEQSSSTTDVTDLFTVTTAAISGGTFRAIYQSTAITTGIFTGGSANVGRSITTAYVTGAGYLSLAREDTQGTGGTLPTITTAYVTGPGAVLDYRGGNITNLYVLGGARFNIAGSLNPATITNVYVDAPSLRASNFKSPFATITYTNQFVYGATIDTVAF